MDILKNLKLKKNIKFRIEDLKSENILLNHHLGLGDHINCNGMVNYLSSKFNKIYIPVKKKYFDMIKFMYKHNNKIELFVLDPSIDEVEQINNFSLSNKLEILRVGYDNLEFPIQESFYKQIGLSYEISKKYFHIDYEREKNIQLETELKKIYNIKNDYKLLHIEGSEGKFPEDQLKVFDNSDFIKVEKETDIFNNLFYYFDLLLKAKEIHCINSAVFCLADRVETNGKLFWHNFKNENPKHHIFNKNWNIINY